MPQDIPLKFQVPDLDIPEREGGYARGRDGYEQILRAALNLLVEHGHQAMTMRRIAATCGLKLGNVTYYFPTREELVRALLDAIIRSYIVQFEAIQHEEGASAEARLEEICTLILEDIRTKKTSHVFPELWAMSNHDPFVMERVQELYVRARAVLNELIAELNPSLPDEEREVLALFISASMEGMTMFAGYRKPFEPRMRWIEKIAAKSFVSLARTLTSSELRDG